MFRLLRLVQWRKEKKNANMYAEAVEGAMQTTSLYFILFQNFCIQPSGNNS